MNVKPGLTFTAGGAEIAAYSEHATAAFVCLYDETGAQEIGRIALDSDGSGWRRAELPGLKPARAMACASTARSSRGAATASMSPSCSSIPTLRA